MFGGILRNFFTILDEINPYEVLNIPETAKARQTKKEFRKLVTNPSREIRVKACLAYDIICNKKNYIKSGDKYRVKNKDHWYYVLVVDLNNLQRLIKNNKSLLYEKDAWGRTLLYLAARNGYYNIVEYLLKNGSNVNEAQNNTGSTALHGAAFYEQEIIVQLLLEYGANTKIKNKEGALPSDDAFTISIKDNILNTEKDEISIFCNDLISKGFARKLELVKYNDEIIGKRILRSEKKLPNDFDYINRNWSTAWHGTKYKFLESIMNYGLRPSGTKLENGEEINPIAGHIKLNKKVQNIENWAKAIFVSPSIFYSADVVYAERIMSTNERYCVIVQCKIRPGSFTSHKSTVLKYKGLDGEPSNVEYRVVYDDDTDLILRVEEHLNVVVTGILFAKTSFLDNITDYVEGNLYLNSEQEKKLFEF